MEWWALLVVAIALAMDAFAVAIAAGITLDPLTWRHVLRLAFHFGLFQALMPVLGWAAGAAVHRYLAHFDHWLAFGLLAFVGGRMLHGARGKKEEHEHKAADPTAGWELVLLSVATSIDALAVGLSLALLGSDILRPALVIGVVAAAFTALGMLLGRRIGSLWGKRVEALGGLVLIAIGVKIVAEHLAG
ncbi:MAG: manganese efflux pump [Deltaproteobacteria bacterium]|nr:manganese efflux pump [Deltaproteobacteria bacterium]